MAAGAAEDVGVSGADSVALVVADADVEGAVVEAAVEEPGVGGVSTVSIM